MQFVSGVLLRSFVILLLGNAIDCARMKIYYVQMVADIRAGTEYESQTRQFANTELDSPLFNTDVLPAQERWDMCNEASQVINEDGGYVLIAKLLQADILRSYAVDSDEWGHDIQMVVAFACPTKPVIYLHATDQSNTLAVGVVIKRRDIRLRDPCVIGNMLYVQKLVREVRPVEELPWISGAVNLIRKGVGAFDSNRSSDLQLIGLEMCRRALMNVLADRNITLLENFPADVKRLYVLQSEKNAALHSVVEAFGCPTVPRIYLQVRSVVENGAAVYWAWAIAEAAPKPSVPSDTGLKYQYHLEVVQCITTSTEFLPDDIRDIPEQQRLSMCWEALTVPHTKENRKVEFLEGGKPGTSEFYRVLFTTDAQPARVLAFKCPTKPALFLAAVEQHVWIFMEEIELVFPRLAIVGYQVEIISDIVEVTLSQLRETPSSVTVHTSVIGPECNVPDECRKLCEQAVAYVQERTQIDVEFFMKTEIGPSRYYVMKTATESQGRGASASEPRPVAVQALKCPTDPEIYLYIRLMVGTGHIMRIYVRKMKTAPTLQVARFEPLLFKEIQEASDYPGARRSPRMSAVNTDALDEEQRRRLCRSAVMYALSKPNLEYVESADTGKLKFYTLDREGEDGRILRSVVQAFGCPTKPAIYLHIGDQDDNGHVVWIIEKIVVPSPPEELFPPIEFLTFDVKLVKSITKATTQDIGEPDISSLLNNLTLDAETFPEQYRYRLCARAAEIVSAEKVQMRPNSETGSSILYSIVELRKSNYKPAPVKAFQCPSEPPIFLQVNKESSVETYSVIILVMKSNLIDVRNEVHYFLKFVESIATVAPSTSKEYGSIESSAVDVELFTRKQRFQMCEEALKRVPSTSRSVEILDGGAAPQKLYSLGLRSRDENLQSHTVQAFQCSIAPEVYLELHYWQSKGLAAWVIAKKREVARPTSSELREPPKAPVRSRDSAVRGQPKPTEPARKPFRESPRESRRPREGIRESQSSARRPKDDAGAGFLRELKNFKVKFVEEINAATSREIGSMLPSPRALSMVNTDEQYSEPQRVEICSQAARRVQMETTVQTFNGLTGESRLFKVDEGFVVDNIPEIKCVRAFECPTEPPLFLEVRHRKHKGTTVTIMMKEFKPIKHSISFMVKPVDSIKPAHLASNVSASGPSMLSSKGKRPTTTNDFPPIKLLRMCRRAWRIAFKGRLQLSSADAVNTSGEYVIDSDSSYAESVHALKCATVPPIYLEVHRRVPGDYSVLIIKERNKRDTALSSFSMEENITYQRKIVTTITQAPPQRIREILQLMPHLEDSNVAIRFDEGERMLMCRDAMKKCPGIEFEYDDNARRDITRTYILDADTEHEEYVKAFKCPTLPVLHIQLEEDEDGSGYTAWMIIAENLPPAGWVAPDRKVEERSVRRTGQGQQTSPYYDLMRTPPENRPSSSAERNVSDGTRSYPRHELRVVEKIVKADAKELKVDDLTHPEPVKYSLPQRERMCEEGRTLVPGKEFIRRLEDLDPRDHELYIISYNTELEVLRDQVISAFLCPYEPPFIIQTYDKIQKRRVTRAIIMRGMIPKSAPSQS